MTSPVHPWLTIHDAAKHLSLSPEALRKALARRAVRAPDGGTEANFDGVRARKIGDQWRVCLGSAWGTPEPRKPLRKTVPASEMDASLDLGSVRGGSSGENP